MAKSKSPEAERASEPPVAPVAPKRRKLRVCPPMSLLWPFNPQPIRAPSGAVVWADDPLIDTTHMDLAIAREFNVLRFSQRDRFEGAPDDAPITIHGDARAAALYIRLGWNDDGYQPVALAAAEKAASDAALPPKPDLRRESPTLKQADLDAIPDRLPAAAAPTS